ncbi:3-phosphoshikimate 1-carboxyvinyltransferase, partial [Mesorhizobium sp. M00.F.Ca.ET.186.01.1.1]
MLRVRPAKKIAGTVRVPGDKSISHRAVMFGALAEGVTTIEGFLPGADCLSTISCFRRMGIEIEQQGDKVTVQGKGWYGLQEPMQHLDVGNSGTTIRLMSGILATQPF